MRVWSRATYVDLLELISLVVGSPQASKKLVRMLHLFVNYKWQRSCHLIVNTLLHVNYRFLIVCFAHYQNQQNNSLHTYFGLKAQNSSNKMQQSCILLLECTPKKASPKFVEMCVINIIFMDHKLLLPALPAGQSRQKPLFPSFFFFFFKKDAESTSLLLPTPHKHEAFSFCNKKEFLIFIKIVFSLLSKVLA